MNNTKAESNSMSLASLVFGILAVLSSFIVVLTPLFAGLAITFAWLSRGDKHMSNQAIAGNILAVISIVVSFAVLMSIIVICAAAFADPMQWFISMAG